MENLRVSCIQTDLVWTNLNANHKNLELLITTINNTDLIVLPETFSTGFCIKNPEFAETKNESLLWMKKWAVEKKCAICGSVFVKENEKLYNRFYFVFPNGNFEYYNKRHLFTLTGEHELLTAGDKQLIVDYNGWKIMCTVCFDLRFPVWCRNNNTNPVDLFLLVANWPTVRIDAWRTLLKARAIENQYYVVGVNRVGVDGTGIEYNGFSTALNPLGEIIKEEKEITLVFNFVLNKNGLKTTRSKLPFLESADEFKLM